MHRHLHRRLNKQTGVGIHDLCLRSISLVCIDVHLYVLAHWLHDNASLVCDVGMGLNSAATKTRLLLAHLPSLCTSSLRACSSFTNILPGPSCRPTKAEEKARQA
jgi:hypothetical protein